MSTLQSAVKSTSINTVNYWVRWEIFLTSCCTLKTFHPLNYWHRRYLRKLQLIIDENLNGKTDAILRVIISFLCILYIYTAHGNEGIAILTRKENTKILQMHTLPSQAEEKYIQVHFLCTIENVTPIPKLYSKLYVTVCTTTTVNGSTDTTRA